MKQYMVSDTFDKDLPVMVGTMKEVANWLGMAEASVRCAINKKRLALRRYYVARMEEYNKGEGDGC